MIDRINKDDNRENIKLFSDLRTPIEYSSVSKELNMKYKDFTFSTFYNNLKNYSQKLKSSNINTIFSITNGPRKSKIINEKQFDFKKIKNAIEKMKEKENILKQKRDHPYTERSLHSHPIYTLVKDRIKSKEREEISFRSKFRSNKTYTPEIGRYNPSYKAINKHLHQVIFSLKNYEEFNNAINQKMSINKINISNNNISLSTNRSRKSKTDKKLSSHIKSMNKTQTLNVTQNKRNSGKLNYKDTKKYLNKNIFYNTSIPKNTITIDGRNNNKNNHCLRFETYCSRKPLINPIFYNIENKFKAPDSSTPRIIKGNVEFEKISSEKNSKNFIEKIVYNKKDTPSIGFYRPNYTIISKKEKDVIFDKEKKSKKNLKITKLKKILTKYHVRGEYELFNILNINNHEISKEKIN